MFMRDSPFAGMAGSFMVRGVKPVKRFSPKLLPQLLALGLLPARVTASRAQLDALRAKAEEGDPEA